MTRTRAPRVVYRNLWLGSMAALASALVSGCYDKLSCEETKTCRPEGVAGEAGAAGYGHGSEKEVAGQAGEAQTDGGAAAGGSTATDEGHRNEAGAAAEAGAKGSGGSRGEVGSGRAGAAGDAGTAGARAEEGGSEDAGGAQGDAGAQGEDGSGGQGGSRGEGGAGRAGAGDAGRMAAGNGGTGAGGHAQAAGTAGATPVEPECHQDDDCDDDLYCNGLESCDGGQCRAGEAPNCENPDAAHCSATCVEGPSGAECVVAALDKDRDTHGSADCAAAPGDDCDDDCDACYPGAEEICDGVDNDCNGLVDLFDGLELGGVADSLLPTGAVQNALWWPAADAYVVTAQDTSGDTKEVLFFVEPDGQVRSGPIDMAQAELQSPPIGRIAVSGDELAALIQTDNGTVVKLARYDTTGTFIGSYTLDPGAFGPVSNYQVGALVSSDAGAWFGSWSGEGNGYLVRWASDGTQSSPLINGTTAAYFGAANGTHRAFASSYRTVTLGNSGGALDYRNDIDLSTISAFGAGDTGYALISGSGAAKNFRELGFDLTDRCGPIAISDALFSRELPKVGKYWIAFSQPATLPSVLVVEEGCGASLVAPVTNSSVSYSGQGAAASGPKGSIIVWQGTGFSINFRVIGPHLCDLPVP